MANEQHLLEVNHLKTSFFTESGEVKSVDDVSYYIDNKEIVAVVGESGCGKSVTQMSVMQLVQRPPGRILDGEVLFEGQNLLDYSPDSKQMRAIRGAKIAMIFQEPMTSLNPVIRVGKQMTEVIRTHKKVSKNEACSIAIQALKDVGIPEPEIRMSSYPFEMSGGMRQRVLIAMAVACESKLIIADEPTTALDVTTQAQVMELLKKIVIEKNKSMLIVTHNLGLVTRFADRIYVMYAGKIVESGTAEDLITNPKHPYTVGLLKAVPKINDKAGEDLYAIEGSPPNLANLPSYCAFYPRCAMACDECKKSDVPKLRKVMGREHYVACHVNVEE